MKVTNLHYKNLNDLQQRLKISHLDTEKTLIQVFSGFVTQEEVKQLQSTIKSKNPQITFIGTTTAGEIYEGGVYENSIGISIMEFEHTTINQGHFLNDDPFKLGKQIATSLFTPKTKASILFINGLTMNGNDVIDGISSINNTIPLAGGVAGDNGYFQKSFVFDNNGVYENGTVAVSLNSEKLHVFTEYQLNWQPIGKTMTVTKAEKNRLYEIDGISASQIYKKYLGEKVGSNLPYSATEFPLLKIEDDGLQVCRAFTHLYDDGSLQTTGNIEVGDKVRLAFGNVDLILNNTKKHLQEYNSFQPEALFIYSCTIRKVFLQSEIVAELEPLNKIAPNIGFFTYGEIYHQNKKNSLLNVSLTILALSEEETQRKYRYDTKIEDDEFEKNFIKNKHYLVLDALTTLSNTVIAELEEAQQQLKEQANRDYLTGLYNRRYFNEIAQDLLHISKRKKKPFSVLMLDIDKFKSINDTYGHNVGDDVIKTLANTIIETVRESDVVSRYGGEEFALMLPFTDQKGAYKIAERIRTNVENKKIISHDGEIIQFTVSIGIDTMKDDDTNIEQALKRADEALYTAKRTGRNKVIVY